MDPNPILGLGSHVQVEDLVLVVVSLDVGGSRIVLHDTTLSVQH